MTYDDNYFMQQALTEAKKAEEEDEIPVGAIVVCQNKIIARAHNQTERLTDVTAHAEMLSITSATAFLSAKYLDTCTLYVTLEPCVMCAGALAWAQIQKIVYGASDPKRGFSRVQPSILHPKTEVVGGVLAEDCRELLLNFFQKKR